MKLTPTEQTAINRKALMTLKVSCDLKPDALRRDLAKFIQEVLRTITTKRLKHVKLALVETEEEKS